MRMAVTETPMTPPSTHPTLTPVLLILLALLSSFTPLSIDMYLPALPTIAGEIVLQLKATPLAFTVTVMDLYAVAFKVRQDTLLVYEPLLVVTLFYVVLTALITRAFGVVEAQVPIRR